MEPTKFQFGVTCYSSSELMAMLDKIEVKVRSVDDGFFENGNKLLKGVEKKGVISFPLDEKVLHPKNKVSCHVLGCNHEFDTVYEYDNHYKLAHNFLCSECKKALPTAHLLDLHISETHDSFFAALAERKSNYQCFLETCTVLSANPEQRRDHCIRDHKFPHNYPFDQIDKFKKPRKPRRASSNSAEMDVSVDEATTLLQEECNLKGNGIEEEDDAIKAIEKMEIETSAKKSVYKNFSFGHIKQKTFSKTTKKESAV